MKFKVGDRVKIKSFDEIMETMKPMKCHNLPGFIDEKMGKYCGMQARIVDMDGEIWFNLDVDDEEWAWDQRWLEKQSVIELNNNLFEL